MSQKFTKQNLRIKWITSFSLIYLMRVTHAITLTHLFLNTLTRSVTLY